jgi:membrane-bound lytic murein transglycosylase D
MRLILLLANILLATTTYAANIKANPNSDNLWEVIRKDFTLPSYYKHEEVKKQIAWFQKHPKHLKISMQRAEPFLYYIYQEVKKRNLPVEFTLLPIIESAFDPFDHSHRGASGIWQIMPRTAKHLGIQRHRWYDGRRDVVHSTAAALNYIQYLYNHFNQDWMLTLAAYNAGETRVRRLIKEMPKQKIDFWSMKLPRETKNYVPRFFAALAIIKNPERYGFTLPMLKNEEHFVQVNIKAPLRLATIASIANLKVDQLLRLNAGYLCPQFSSKPLNAEYTLTLPKVSVEHFLQNLDNYLARHAQEYVVNSGDNLTTIAKAFHSSVNELREFNNLQTDTLRIGQKLHIPPDPTIVEYQVEAGDNLSKIAQHYQTTVSELKTHNQLRSNTIRIGQRLYIPHETKAIEHVIQNGDSLSRIAYTYRVNTNDLKSFNHLTSDRIVIGQTLLIPPRS